MSAWDWTVVGLLIWIGFNLAVAALLYSADDEPFKAPCDEQTGFWP